MPPTFETTRARGWNWRRELTPVIAVAALAADYLSPAELWTILLPFAGVTLLLALRKPVVAAMVFVMSSWVLVPSAAHVVTAVEDARGEHYMLTTDDGRLPGAWVSTAPDPCFPYRTPWVSLPIGPGHLLNPRWALRDAIGQFVRYHNELLIERAYRTCDHQASVAAAD